MQQIVDSLSGAGNQTAISDIFFSLSFSSFVPSAMRQQLCPCITALKASHRVESVTSDVSLSKITVLEDDGIFVATSQLRQRSLRVPFVLFWHAICHRAFIAGLLEEDIAGVVNRVARLRPLDRLQYTQNSIARELNSTRLLQHINSTLKCFHWLPVKFYITYKTSPPYHALAQLCQTSHLKHFILSFQRY